MEPQALAALPPVVRFFRDVHNSVAGFQDDVDGADGGVLDTGASALAKGICKLLLGVDACPQLWAPLLRRCRVCGGGAPCVPLFTLEGSSRSRATYPPSLVLLQSSCRQAAAAAWCLTPWS
jgi:hypothetical protein